MNSFVPRQVAGEVELFEAFVAFVLFIRVRLVNQNVRIQSSTVLKHFATELTDLFAILSMDVFEVKLEVSLVEELSVALWTRNWILQLFLWILFLLARRTV